MSNTFISQARRVCNYLVSSGSPFGAEMEAALEAYDASNGGSEQLIELRRVASTVYPTIEKRTLAAVLNGRFTLDRREGAGLASAIIAPTNLVAVLGLALILLSLHWTYWSTRAGAVIGSLDRVLETQRSLNIEEIVHTRDLCQFQGAALDDQDVYRFVVATRDMAYYDTIWVSSRTKADTLKLGFWPMQRQYRSAKTYVASRRAPDPPGAFDPNTQLLGKQEFATCDYFRKLDKHNLDSEVQWYNASFVDLAETIPLQSGVELFRGTGIASIEVLNKDLTELQVVVHRWLLPTLHGALGAMIFCLVRAIREPFLYPLGPRDVFLRLFFGAFVGYLISAIFIPAGLLGQAVGSATPMVSLLAFVFGYSIDAFIALLNRMNGYVIDLSKPNERS